MVVVWYLVVRQKSGGGTTIPYGMDGCSLRAHTWPVLCSHHHHTVWSPLTPGGMLWYGGTTIPYHVHTIPYHHIFSWLRGGSEPLTFHHPCWYVYGMIPVMSDVDSPLQQTDAQQQQIEAQIDAEQHQHSDQHIDAHHQQQIDAHHQQQQQQLPVVALPPSSVTSHNASSLEEDEGDEDDDDDNWSRQVETDETTALDGFTSVAGPMESVAEEEQEGAVGVAHVPVPHPPPPLTLKEEAIARERQRRIETERARLKRQFVINKQRRQQQQSNGSGSEVQALDSPGRPGFTGSSQISPVTPPFMPMAPLDSGSVAETVESTRVHPDEETADNPEMRLGFNMERFLRNSQDFQPAQDEQTSNSVLMERFLHDVGDAGRGSLNINVGGGSLTVNNMNVGGNEDQRSEQPSEPRSEPVLHSPRGLTEADLVAAEEAEEASIANAPPSEREELLFSDLADFASNTVTTAMASEDDVVVVEHDDDDGVVEHDDNVVGDHDHGNLTMIRPSTPPVSNAAGNIGNAIDTIDTINTTDPHSPRAFTPWSPPGKMHVSPVVGVDRIIHGGSLEHIAHMAAPSLEDEGRGMLDIEQHAMNADVPPEIITTEETPLLRRVERAPQNDAPSMAVMKTCVIVAPAVWILQAALNWMGVPTMMNRDVVDLVGVIVWLVCVIIIGTRSGPV